MLRLVEYIKRFGRFQRDARLYLISYILSGVTVGIFLVLYNLYLVSLDYGTDFIGLVLFTGTIGAGLAIFPAGFCIDHLGGKLILIGASLLISAAGIGQILFRQPTPLLITSFLGGIGGAFLLVVNAPFLIAHSSPTERSHLFSLNIVVSLVTTVVGELIGGVLPLWLRASSWLMAALPSSLNWMLASHPVPRSYQLALLLAGLIAAPSFLPLFLMSDDRPSKVTPSADPSLVSSQVSLLPLKANQRIKSLLYNTKATIIGWRQQGNWRTLVLSPLIVLVVIQLLIGLGAGLFIPYFNVFFVQHLHASPALFGVIDGTANTLNALLTLLAPWLAMRIGKIRTITITRLASIPLMLLIGLSGSLPFAAVLYPLRQGMMDMSLGLLQVFSMEAVPERHRGIANSSYQATYQIAWAIAAPIGGLIIARLGYSPVFIAASCLYLLAIGTIWGRFGRGHYDDYTQNRGSEPEVGGSVEVG